MELFGRGPGRNFSVAGGFGLESLRRVITKNTFRHSYLSSASGLAILGQTQKNDECLRVGERHSPLVESKWRVSLSIYLKGRGQVAEI